MSTDSPKTYSIKNYGCQMNVYDGERMAEMFESQGMTPADEKANADLVVLNTCHIREKAAEKVYSEIGRLRRKDGSSPVIAVAGCVAQAEGGEISRRAPEVDIVVGPQAYHNLPEMVAAVGRGERVVDLDLPGLDKFGKLPARRKQAPSAFLTVQEGCDKFCTYCVVPYTRGAEISRGWNELIDEAKAIVDAGAAEITLLGQNVNAWDGEDDKGQLQGLDGLIRALDKIPGLRRIRYMTSHPNDMTEGLIAAHGDVEKLMPFLHLPVQSGSDRILKAMNRSHSRDSYLRILDRVRTVRPDIAFSGDFIVGFPGETEEDFEDTLRLVREVGHAQAYSFKYSPRPGTPAADMDDQIAMEIMDERLQRLQAQIVADQTAFNRNTVGKTCDVLLERPGKFDGQLIGKSPWLQSVHVLAPDLSIGNIVSVQITDSGPLSLKGEPTMRAAA
ncbi:MAG: tRNA (N6-isopentenyl adenosine(37)-C2)-methylthiotransferase MiaB [Sphingomonadales bacterium 35-56-22]|jgi:tRNA-2-methylthio-N6-dimethylallyladenosine synthase|uniref:tRNA (N6-isopentenyl adenosine(37)-C2)-methylthiotransferase MiaB n=1 Tax=Sphingorhabdus sp. TaxID=1902408 RepID=UPI000BD0BBB0|nr:tRNA (N6-isopentenyl adenosine(37)-C2)-methylthiotransferase MiaB [Sphingorhabdus sp.]OYY16537.1 MAG: tRNA (N6-isopentenyl adenosine(37)-C2)-methylthiotransferase MiaB [Sphingomonadales bacterium 35-56-22]OYY98303.1 MAG: tRNA (N6-isopentenyl adenosine(37)-C2)-methylthiotransferase MiaB [Sphingomonadales bacterium 28-56-43]OYZ60775.1 MAG: tRNA (N6-isopentenyl adenosine(37)-C2)-methylthiotransferase MiaB [Sphingomonadales bacterium 24-56-14]OZA83675.1 MAG: tRNA (N6-isopentenyl adenosine(37)-C2